MVLEREPIKKGHFVYEKVSTNRLLLQLLPWNPYSGSYGERSLAFNNCYFVHYPCSCGNSLLWDKNQDLLHPYSCRHKKQVILLSVRHLRLGRWTYNLLVNSLVRINTSDIRVLGFQTEFWILFQLPAITDSVKHKNVAQGNAFCHQCGRSELIPWILVSAWPNLAYYWTLWAFGSTCLSSWLFYCSSNKLKIKEEQYEFKYACLYIL